MLRSVARPGSSRRSGGSLFGEVAEEGVRLGQGGGEDLLCHCEQLRGARVADAVVDAGAGAAAFEHAVLTQCGEVLGGAARIESERVLQVADGALAVVEELEDADPDGMA